MWVDVVRAVGGDSCGRRLASRGGSGFCKNNSGCLRGQNRIVVRWIRPYVAAHCVTFHRSKF